jgi:molybdopterin converting factor small subunit
MLINLYATFRVQAGVKTLEVNLPTGTTLRNVVDRIIEKIPALKTVWLTEEGEIQNYVYGFINGTDSGTLPEGWETKLRAEDVIDFLPPVAGG